jgi:hypothetical protein
MRTRGQRTRVASSSRRREAKPGDRGSASEHPCTDEGTPRDASRLLLGALAIIIAILHHSSSPVKWNRISMVRMPGACNGVDPRGNW